jgi:positive phototaxis protein PixI
MEVSELKESGVEEQFLRFSLSSRTKGLISISQMSEVLTINLEQILPMPHMKPWVMGVYNWRGEILWMVDLGNLLGFPPLHEERSLRSSYKAIVLHLPLEGKKYDPTPDRTLGLVVSQIEDIEWCNPASIESPPPSVDPKLIPFLRGYYLKSDREALAVLEGEYILARMLN